ncbi:DUF4040 domain-containing protein [Cyanobacterium aponinum UTEX 3222]|uniref:MrpA C-terminal/MbhD domain-containing protein n=3 Tax=Cyanobacterium aponinum TaxID=379064 RepID=K9Z571_CYAAP|nr:DUF4040 domain-containing protein [Cyanobacterium aponinum]WRL43756.1 DUF4040 domain-containing protein [Cyanobacterium aponinum UTEX 3222]AFZ54289.1 hypothetical protein Cyan10605_2203 [Cyanobacterium aponinum PCC 10605]MBD2393896.1 DUF4040 domain-containing protein [Cyanobacterium aponinum FACHB-4101]MTF39566.1 DUF4040 domain-containing protein [Cyanobacterium aponinum 0216]PHV62076.1 hypothetical protein CSQ80_12020 [Cyanobacterium aponinum IPPAS B-1201]
MDNLYIYLIMALLPISALMLMIQVNPYQALVIRGILGAIAVLSYIILGAADVALTEGLMGTMLGVALYIIAVRSSFVMRLGVIQEDKKNTEKDPNFDNIKNQIKQVINNFYLRLELVYYSEQELLKNSFNDKKIHGYILTSNQLDKKYLLNIRTKRLFDILQQGIKSEQLLIGYQMDIKENQDQYLEYVKNNAN